VHVLAAILRVNATALAAFVLSLTTQAEQIPVPSAQVAQLAGQALQRLLPGL
jgi:hypothetical protein